MPPFPLKQENWVRQSCRTRFSLSVRHIPPHLDQQQPDRVRGEVQRHPTLRTINDPGGRQRVHSGPQLRVRVLGPLAAAEGQKRLPGACEAFLFFSYILSEFLKKLVAPQ